MSSKKPIWREYGEALAIAFVLAMVIRFFVVQAYQIPSGSMLDSLLIGDRLLVSKLSYNIKVPFTDKVIMRLGEPEHGDIVVFTTPDPEQPGADYIKRVIGVPGDVIEMKNNVVIRNGTPIDEPYARKTRGHMGGFTSYMNIHMFVQGNIQNFEPLTVPADKYFVLGDNRDDSRDSRFWGLVDRNAMHGKAWRIYWSWGKRPGDSGSSGFPDTGPRWSRMGKLVE